MKISKKKKNTIKMILIILVSICILYCVQWILGKIFSLSFNTYTNTDEETSMVSISDEEKKILHKFEHMQNEQIKNIQLINFIENNINSFSKSNSCKLIYSYIQYQKPKITYIQKFLNSSDNKSILLSYIKDDGSIGTSVQSIKEVNLEKIKSIEKSSLKDYIKELYQSGYKIIYDGYNFIPLINFSYYIDRFSKSLSLGTKSYFELMTKEQLLKLSLNYTQIIDLSKIEDIILQFENYIKQNPNSFNLEETKDTYCNYIKLYTLGSDKFRTYDKNNILLPELRERYESLIYSNKDGKLKDLIKGLMDILQTSNYSLNNKVEDYILDNLREILR